MYYAEKLSGGRLRRCYEIAPPRVQQYLEAEILHALGRIEPTDEVLELGCGYGRIALRMAAAAKRVVGIDTSPASLDLARELAGVGGRCEFMQRDALDLRFPDGSFDAVMCLQNGICAFGVDHARLLQEALRVSREGGRILLSSYADAFWPHRLAWFEAQAEEGLIGPIDRAACQEGIIVCEDGFRAGRLTPEGFCALCSGMGLSCEVIDADGSSVFCEIIKPHAVDAARR